MAGRAGHGGGGAPGRLTQDRGPAPKGSQRCTYYLYPYNDYPVAGTACEGERSADSAIRAWPLPPRSWGTASATADVVGRVVGKEDVAQDQPALGGDPAAAAAGGV